MVWDLSGGRIVRYRNARVLLVDINLYEHALRLLCFYTTYVCGPKKVCACFCFFFRLCMVLTRPSLPFSAQHVIRPSVDSGFFFRCLSLSCKMRMYVCLLCRATCTQYDDIELHPQLCLLQKNNAVSLCRTAVVTVELVFQKDGIITTDTWLCRVSTGRRNSLVRRTHAHTPI